MSIRHILPSCLLQRPAVARTSTTQCARHRGARQPRSGAASGRITSIAPSGWARRTRQWRTLKGPRRTAEDTSRASGPAWRPGRNGDDAHETETTGYLSGIGNRESCARRCWLEAVAAGCEKRKPSGSLPAIERPPEGLSSSRFAVPSSLWLGGRRLRRWRHDLEHERLFDELPDLLGAQDRRGETHPRECRTNALREFRVCRADHAE